MIGHEEVARLERLIKAGVLALVAAVPLAYGGPYFSDFFAIKFAFLHAGAGLLVGLAWAHWVLAGAGRCARSPCDWSTPRDCFRLCQTPPTQSSLPTWRSLSLHWACHYHSGNCKIVKLKIFNFLFIGFRERKFQVCVLKMVSKSVSK